MHCSVHLAPDLALTHTPALTPDLGPTQGQAPDLTLVLRLPRLPLAPSS